MLRLDKSLFVVWIFSFSPSSRNFSFFFFSPAGKYEVPDKMKDLFTTSAKISHPRRAVSVLWDGRFSHFRHFFKGCLYQVSIRSVCMLTWIDRQREIHTMVEGKTYAKETCVSERGDWTFWSQLEFRDTYDLPFSFIDVFQEFIEIIMYLWQSLEVWKRVGIICMASNLGHMAPTSSTRSIEAFNQTRGNFDKRL